MSPQAAGGLAIGVDIGGTKTDTVVLTPDGAVVGRLRTPTGTGATEVLAAAVRSVRGLMTSTGMAPGDLRSIGVGIPGRVDVTTGVVTHAVHLDLQDMPLGQLLADELGAAVRVENDVNAAAVGAFHLLELPASASLGYLNLGTGLAAGLVVEGRLWRGVGGNAGEIGHIPVDPRGVECRCGQRGCLEVSASGSAIARLWPTSHPRPIQELLDAATRGDTRAVKVRAGLMDAIAAAVRMLVLNVDVDQVVVGGGLASAGQPLIDGVREVLARWEQDSPFIRSLDLPGRIQVLGLGGAIGGAAAGAPVAALGAAYLGAAAVAATSVGAE